jgi:hypothetical protein
MPQTEEMLKENTCLTLMGDSHSVSEIGGRVLLAEGGKSVVFCGFNEKGLSMKSLSRFLYVTIFCVSMGFSQVGEAKSAAFSASLSPGLSVLGSAFGPSVSSYLGFAPLADHEFYVGGDVGLAIYLPGAFIMQIDLLPTAWYQFRIPRAQNFQPVVGISFGPSLLVGSAGGFTASGVTYAFYFRPGFLYRTGSNQFIGADLKFGVFGGAFTFRPQANFVWEL